MKRVSIVSSLWLAALPSCVGAPALTSLASANLVKLTRQSTLAACLEATGGNPIPCGGIAWDAGNSVEIGKIDIDGDGGEDLVVRRMSPVSCGSKGCSTDIFLRTRSGLMVAEPRLVTAGPISTCFKDGARGLRATASPSAPCFIFQTANQ